jgi:hypothetical protein
VAAASETGRPAATRWHPSSLNLLFFTVSTVDGAFAMTLSLLLAGSLGVGSALLAAGLLLVAGLVGMAHGIVYPAAVAIVVARLGLPLLYDALAVVIILALVAHRLAGGDRMYAIRGIDASAGAS